MLMSEQMAWCFLRDPKTSQFERALPGGLSNDNDDFFIEGCPQLFGYMVSITVDYPRDHLKPKVIPIEGWLGTRFRQQEWRKKRNGI